MGVFRQFPYSNFHEMNMDEIIKIIKNMLEEWANYHAEWDSWMDQMNDDWSNYQDVMNTAWRNMQNFINNYFDNLDVQEEINNKIVSMVQTGEFGHIVDEYIPPHVSAWLNTHITQPTGVVIDTSLTVSGACADAKATGDEINELKLHDNIIDRKFDELYTIQQTSQVYTTSGDLVTPNFDSVTPNGYYDSTGTWVNNESWRSLIINGCLTDYNLFIESEGFGGVLFLTVYNGQPSQNTFKGFYSSTSNTLPTSENPLNIPAGYIVVFSNTLTSGFKADATNVLHFTASNFLENLTSDLDTRITELEDITDEISPLSEPAIKKTITKDEFTRFGNVVPASNGTFTEYNDYEAYIYEFQESGKFYMTTTGNSTYVFIAVYNSNPSDGDIVNLFYRGSDPVSMGKIDVTEGQFVCVSLHIPSNPLTFQVYLDYHARMNLFRHDMKIAWFGDSISQLQQLPQRVGNYMACTVYNCSFAGAPLSYGSELYDALSVRSLSSQIVNNNFTYMDDAIEAAEEAGIDVTRKVATANIIKNLNFSKDVTHIVIMAGTNDLNNDYVTTSSDLTSFEQAVQTIITNFNTAFPGIRIYFITDPYRGDITPSNPDRHGHSLIDINNIIKEVCEENNIAFFDLYHSSGINANTMGYFLDTDHLHQTEAGDILLSEKCAKWLDAN